MAEQVKAAPKARQRRVNFFELVQQTKGNSTKRMKHADWSKILLKLQSLPLKQRVVETRTRTLIGDVLSVDGKPHLKLMKVRDESAWLEVYNPDAESIADLDLTGVLLETSIIAFLDYGNVIGMVLGSTTAPTPTAVSEWINGLGFLGKDIKVDTQAMVSKDALTKLQKAPEAARIETKVHTSRADALIKRGSKLGTVLKTVREEYGPMTVTVILQASKKRDQGDGRKELREEASKVLEAADHHEVAKAKVKLLYVDADETTHLEDVDFVKQRITAKALIATTSEDGSPIRDSSAVQAILQVASTYDAEIKAIVNTELG